MPPDTSDRHPRNSEHKVTPLDTPEFQEFWTQLIIFMILQFQEFWAQSDASRHIGLTLASHSPIPRPTKPTVSDEHSACWLRLHFYSANVYNNPCITYNSPNMFPIHWKHILTADTKCYMCAKAYFAFTHVKAYFAFIYMCASITTVYMGRLYGQTVLLIQKTQNEASAYHSCITFTSMPCALTIW